MRVIGIGAGDNVGGFFEHLINRHEGSAAGAERHERFGSRNSDMGEDSPRALQWIRAEAIENSIERKLQDQDNGRGRSDIYPLLPRAPLPAEATAGLRADSDRRIIAAVGQTTDLERQVYEGVLLDTLVHELNTVRGLLGEPTRLEYVSLALDCVTVMLRFASLPVAIHWIDLPGIARYGMEFALYAPERRLTLTFPSPFLRNEPATLEIENGAAGSARAWRTEEVASYESGFKRELEAFHDWIVAGREPVTTAGTACATSCCARPSSTATTAASRWTIPLRGRTDEP